MNHPKKPLPNDASWSTGDEGFDLRIRLSLAERDSLRAQRDAAVEALALAAEDLRFAGSMLDAICRTDSSADRMRARDAAVEASRKAFAALLRAKGGQS